MLRQLIVKTANKAQIGRSLNITSRASKSLFSIQSAPSRSFASSTILNDKSASPDFCVNKVTLIGYVGKDAESRKSATGGHVTFFSMATSEVGMDLKGKKYLHTDWHRVVVYGERLGNVVEKLATKGARVYIDGSVRTRRYTDALGNERSQTEVVLQPYSGEFLVLTKNAEMDMKQFDDDMGDA